MISILDSPMYSISPPWSAKAQLVIIFYLVGSVARIYAFKFDAGTSRRQTISFYVFSVGRWSAISDAQSPTQHKSGHLSPFLRFHSFLVAPEHGDVYFCF